MQPDALGSGAPLRIREAVRALVIDPDDRLLLVRFEFPEVHVWAAPGGGMEPGETPDEALRREMREELGLTDITIGPEVWERTHIVPFINGLWDGQHDRFFLVRTDAFEPAPTLTVDQLNAEYVFEMRWWTPAQLELFDPSPSVLFAPRRLPALYRTLLCDGVPAAPIDTGR
jgi:ADP-ribose pyrophosphatase YjhB (NUDIX family)